MMAVSASSKKAIVFFIVVYIIISIAGAWLASKIAKEETRRETRLMQEIQELKAERMPPTPEQMLLLRTIHKLEVMEKRLDKVATVASNSNTILKTSKATATAHSKSKPPKTVKRPPFMASTTKPKISIPEDIWSKQAEENRKKWNAWADHELERLRENNK